MRKHRLLIVGTPRSGTTYLAACFNELGLDVGHENIKADGGVGWNFADGAVRLERNLHLRDFDMVCHVLRHPCHAVPSIDVNFGHYLKKFDSNYGSIAKWWFYWNQMCEALLANAKHRGCQTMTFRIEDGDDVIPFLARECGASRAGDSFAHISKTTHHQKEYEPWEWADFPSTARCYAEKWYKIRARAV